MKAPRYEVADVLNQGWQSIESKEIALNSWQIRTLRAIKDCRTSALGGHIDGCSSCGHLQLSYNSCRNRHCPKCQGHKKEQWVQARNKDLLPAPYFHVVFTLPQEINAIALVEPKIVYNVLFKAAWATIKNFGSDAKWLGGTMGMVSILHTWGQNLSLHPHLHCIVPGVAVTEAGFYKRLKTGSKILFPVRAMSRMFRGKFCALLKTKLPDHYHKIQHGLYRQDWVVYAKKPFGGPKHVIEYLGRYTHKIAISNHRLTALSKKQITFNYKYYRAEGKSKQMQLSVPEFIRRFSLHILPKGFVRMRHYGTLSSTWKRGKLQELQRKMLSKSNKTDKQPEGQSSCNKLHQCPKCKLPTLVIVCTFDKRGPPVEWMDKLKKYQAVKRMKMN
ncbi:MAG: hypothetical protein ACI83I_001426 [Bacteroidia bacterium]|jgi:hypothetical protein